MELRFSHLQLCINEGTWNVGVSCTGTLLDRGEKVAFFSRNNEVLSITTERATIVARGKLPTSQSGGEGELILEGEKVGSFKSDCPRSSWHFFNLAGNVSTVIRVPNMGQKRAEWSNLQMGWSAKVKYILRGNIEVSSNDICFQSPRYVVSKEPLLSEEEQKLFNENLPLSKQLQVLAGIILVQTTFGGEFVA